MTRLIDADALILHFSDWALSEAPTENDNVLDFAKRKIRYSTIQEAITGIEEAPTIDAVEVVRCEDCKNWNGVLHGGFYYFETCELTSISTNSGDYCSFAEKKEGAE